MAALFCARLRRQLPTRFGSPAGSGFVANIEIRAANAAYWHNSDFARCRH
jgi:hypothetical protein